MTCLVIAVRACISFSCLTEKLESPPRAVAQSWQVWVFRVRLAVACRHEGAGEPFRTEYGSPFIEGQVAVTSVALAVALPEMVAEQHLNRYKVLEGALRERIRTIIRQLGAQIVSGVLSRDMSIYSWKSAANCRQRLRAVR